MLLLSAGHPVSVAALTDAVWQGAPPATARNQIAICITALRRIFRDAAGAEALIETVHNGYALHPGGHRIDLHEVEALLARARELVDDGRTVDAVGEFERVLAMWSGTVLDGLSGGRIKDFAAGLTELWLDVNEDCAELQLQLGRYRPLVSRLTELVKKYPLREHSRLQLMEGQRWLGRRADALETYREGRKVLVEELGIEPGAALQELHHRILQESGGAEQGELPPAARTAPVPVAAVPAELPLSSASFTGRVAEIAALDRLLHQPMRQSPAIAALFGVGGVGKTALAVHWANRVAAHFPDGQLFVDMRGFHEHEEPVSPMSALDRCLRVLGVPSSQIPADRQERAALYRTVLDGRRVLIVLDNVRSLAQILPLLPGQGESCVLITSRNPLDYLAGDYAVVQVGLKPLSQDEAVTMLGATIGTERIAAETEMARRLVMLCDRLPLALRVAGVRLAAKPHRSLSQLVTRLEDRRCRLDLLSSGHVGVRAGLWLSYRELPRAAAQMYRCLGLLTLPYFDVWVGAALLDVDLGHAEDLMEQLVDAQLLEVCPSIPGAPARFCFQGLSRLFAWERAQEEDSEAALDRVFGVWLRLVDDATSGCAGASTGTCRRCGTR